jgi:hypothetical protein
MPRPLKPPIDKRDRGRNGTLVRPIPAEAGMNFELGAIVAHDYQNGEQTEEWPVQDLPGASANAESGASGASGETGEYAEGAENAETPETAEGPANTDSFESTAEVGHGTADDDSDAPVNLGDDADAMTDAGTPGAWNGELTEELTADSSDAHDADDADENVQSYFAASPGESDEDDGDDDEDEDDEETLELENEGVRDIDATNVSITQGGARDVEATTVTITQGGAARVRADSLSINQGGVGFARTDELTLHDGGTAFAVVTDSATFDGQSSVFLLVAGSATGDVKPVLDWRAAAAFGAAFAFVLSLLRRGRR